MRPVRRQGEPIQLVRDTPTNVQGGVREFQIRMDTRDWGARRAGPPRSAGAELPAVPPHSTGSGVRVLPKIGRMWGATSPCGAGAARAERKYLIHLRRERSQKIPKSSGQRVRSALWLRPGVGVRCCLPKSGRSRRARFRSPGASRGGSTNSGIPDPGGISGHCERSTDCATAPPHPKQ